MTVLDASALLAFLFAEPGHQEVAEVVSGSCMSSVNFSEVLGRFARDGHDVQVVAKRLMGVGIEVVPFAAEDAAVAAGLRPATDRQGLSLGDRACLALALVRGLPAVTADQAWRTVKAGVEIRVIR
jgi:PIN domain nuclease of toxin-antitoxin system